MLVPDPGSEHVKSPALDYFVSAVVSALLASAGAVYCAWVTWGFFSLGATRHGLFFVFVDLLMISMAFRSARSARRIWQTRHSGH
jgi:hypothetical protein